MLLTIHGILRRSYEAILAIAQTCRFASHQVTARFGDWSLKHARLWHLSGKKRRAVTHRTLQHRLFPSKAGHQYQDQIELWACLHMVLSSDKIIASYGLELLWRFNHTVMACVDNFAQVYPYAATCTEGQVAAIKGRNVLCLWASFCLDLITQHYQLLYILSLGALQAAVFRLQILIRNELITRHGWETPWHSLHVCGNMAQHTEWTAP